MKLLFLSIRKLTKFEMSLGDPDLFDGTSFSLFLNSFKEYPVNFVLLFVFISPGLIILILILFLEKCFDKY